MAQGMALSSRTAQRRSDVLTPRPFPEEVGAPPPGLPLGPIREQLHSPEAGGGDRGFTAEAPAQTPG